MGELQDLIIFHYHKYPSMQVEDVFKLLYQNEFGCGHMISSHEDSLQRILAEAASLAHHPSDQDTAEPIGNGLCRLYLSALHHGLSAQTLNRLFVMTANQLRGSAAGFEEKAAVFMSLSRTGHVPFDPALISQKMEEYRAAGYPPMRHSLQYRQAYAPAYRVVDIKFCDSISLFYTKEVQ